MQTQAAFPDEPQLGPTGAQLGTTGAQLGPIWNAALERIKPINSIEFLTFHAVPRRHACSPTLQPAFCSLRENIVGEKRQNLSNPAENEFDWSIELVKPLLTALLLVSIDTISMIKRSVRHLLTYSTTRRHTRFHLLIKCLHWLTFSQRDQCCS